MQWPPDVADAHQLDVTWGEDPVLAIDEHRGYAAGFRFSIRRSGDCYADVFFGRLQPDGTLDDMGSGGWSGGWPQPPWRPLDEGWDGKAIAPMGSSGLDVEDDDENELQLLVISGFAAPYAKAVRVEQDGQTRRLPITSPVGAFVVVTLGVSDIVVAPLDASDEPIGPSEVYAGWRATPSP